MIKFSKSFVWGLVTGVLITSAGVLGFLAYVAYTWPGH